jgi:alpha-tubulin suppressor-like RCC1 family protein
VEAPKPVAINERVLDMACGWYHNVAIVEGGRVYVWGREDKDGVLGLGQYHTEAVLEPVLHPRLKNVVKATASGPSTLVMKKNGSAWVWGWNGMGQLGLGDRQSRHWPEELVIREEGGGAKRAIVEVAGGSSHFLALMDDGSLWGWGDNGHGELGMWGAGEIHTPVRNPFPFPHPIVAIGCGWEHSYVVDKEGGLWMWGNNRNLQLGLSEEVEMKSEPTLVGTVMVCREEQWRKMMRWLWIGREDRGSAFFGMLDEILFNFVGLM